MYKFSPRLTLLLQMWVVLAVLSTLLCGLIYLSVQQVFRQGANDPQIGISQDGAAILSNDGPMNAVVPNHIVDIAKSLAVYVIVYDDKGQPIVSSGKLGGQTPVPPIGVFAVAKANGQNRLTWQPAPDVRSAIVVVPFKGKQSSGYVLAGRSLREVEMRESNLTKQIILGWIAALASTLIAVFLLGWLHSKKGL